MAIQKVQQFPLEQRNQVIQFIEFLDSASSQPQTIEPQPQESASSEQAFFELAGLWKNKEITAESLHAEAWREGNQGHFFLREI